MQIHFTDFVTAANLLVLLGIYRKMSIIVYQHKLMWTDFADRKGISANGKARGQCVTDNNPNLSRELRE